MATKLEKLEVTKIDFVNSGANQEADVLIFKSGEPPKEEQENETELSLIDKAFMNLAGVIKKALGKNCSSDDPKEVSSKKKLKEPNNQEDDEEIEDPEGIEKATMFKEKATEVSMHQIFDAIRTYNYSMSESMITILGDEDIEDKKATLLENLNDYFEITSKAIEFWANGKQYTDIAKNIEEIDPALHDVFKSARDWLDEQIEKSNQMNNEMEERSMDLEKMSQEDRTTYEALIAKYDKTETDEAKKKNVQKNADEGSEDIFKGVPEQFLKEFEQLKKRDEERSDKELMEVAKGYEMIGKKADELFPVLKSLRSTDEVAYRSMIDVLDSSKTAVEKSGFFDEIGKSGHGTPDQMTAIQKKAGDLMASNQNLTIHEAIDEVFKSDPELRAEFDK